MLGANSSVECSIDSSILSVTKGNAFENTKRALEVLTAGMTAQDVDTYCFINLFRILGCWTEESI